MAAVLRSWRVVSYGRVEKASCLRGARVSHKFPSPGYIALSLVSTPTLLMHRPFLPSFEGHVFQDTGRQWGSEATLRSGRLRSKGTIGDFQLKPSKVPIGRSTVHCRLVGYLLACPFLVVADICQDRYSDIHPSPVAAKIIRALHGGIEEARENRPLWRQEPKIDSRVSNPHSSPPTLMTPSAHSRDLLKIWRCKGCTYSSCFITMRAAASNVATSRGYPVACVCGACAT